MATITGRRTINRTSIITTNADPNSAGGTDEPVGTICITNSGEIYKKGTSAVDSWALLVVNSMFSGLVNEGGGVFSFDAMLHAFGTDILEPGVNTINLSSVKDGMTLIFHLTTSSIADEVFFVSGGRTTVVTAANSTGAGQLLMTTLSGVTDRVMVTADSTFIYVSPIGQNFIP